MVAKKKQLFSPIPIKAQSIIAIASGKGGVGKSTVTVNLALAMAERKMKVGLLDADIYGPNIPLMLGLEKELANIKESKLIPIKKYNIKVMSVGFVAHPDKALIWRGPLANKVIEQFLSDVEWGELDILLIDLPPGTGDVPLSIIQKTELSGGIVVTTPQEASIADVKKMINMFQTTDTKILGIVENMKYLVCSECSKKIELYPRNEKQSISKILGHDLLGEFPFEPKIGLKKEDGTPFYFSDKNNNSQKEYQKCTDKILKLLK